MDILLGVLEAAITLVAIAVVCIIMAGLFIAVLALATGIDDHVQSTDDGTR